MAIKKRPKYHPPTKVSGGRSSAPGSVFAGGSILPPPLAIDAGGGSLPPAGTVVGPGFPAVPEQASGLDLNSFIPGDAPIADPFVGGPDATINQEGTSGPAIVRAGQSAKGVVIMKYAVPVVVGLVVYFLTRGIGWAILAAIVAFLVSAWWAKKKEASAATSASA